MEKIFIYLAKRDKSGMKIITTTAGKCLPTRLTDIQSLQLAPDAEVELARIAYENRMQWEVWMESAKSFDDLIESLIKRGYKNLPLAPGQMITESLKKLKLSQDRINMQNGQKTMMKRASRS